MKNQLKAGILFLISGVVFVILSFAFPDISIFVGFVGGCFGPGILMIYKYLYWKKRPEEYKQKTEDENIESYDERKEMIRGKALRISTIIIWCIMSATIVVIAFLGQFEVISSELSRYVVMGIAIYWFISVVIMQVVYKYLSSKY